MSDKALSPTFKQQVFVLFDQGHRPSDLEVKELARARDVKNKTIYAYFQDWKKRNGSDDTPTDEASDTTTRPQKEVRAGDKGAPITVGRITITPLNWGMTQEGAIVIIDTYNRAKRDIGYQGTIGDFICDIFTLYRRIQNYEEEVVYVRASEGAGSGEPDAEPGVGQFAEIPAGG